jgi:DNA-binding IclR family transcriptional regulator
VSQGSAESPARTLVRGLRLLEAVAQAPDGLGVTEASNLLGLDKGTSSRLLKTLREMGYVKQRASDRRYVIATKVLQLARSAKDQTEQFRALAMPALEEAQAESGETVHLAILDGNQLFYVEVLESQQTVRVQTSLDIWTDDLRSTAMGRAVLASMSTQKRFDVLHGISGTPIARGADGADLGAEISRAETMGWATVNRHDDVLRVASAIRAPGGHPIGAISLSGPSYRVGVPEALADHCLKAAKRIEAAVASQGVAF